MRQDQEFIDKLVTHLKTSRGEISPSATPRTNGHHRSQAAALTDQEILNLLFSEKGKGNQWESVFNGTHEPYYPSPSEAVAGLLWKLAFYTRKDPEQMERLVRGSALASSKFDERRSGTTWVAREIGKAIEGTDEVYKPSGRSRPLASSSSTSLGFSSDDDTNGDALEVLWFSELGEPKERRFLIESIGVEGYPIVAFGAGGVAKSFAMLLAGIAIASASDVNEWLGLRVLEHGHVLYLDFELDADEQHRRVRDMCAGLGVPIPKRLAYLSGVGIPPERAFEKARAFVDEYKAKAIIIDSMGLAMQGDMERGKDVLAFHGRYINPLRRLGTTPFIVDHEGKLQAGEKHKDKSPFGSAYKAWASRSVLQFELDEYDKETSELSIRVRQTKTNFGPKIEPIGVRFTFQEKKVSVKPYKLDDTELVEEESVPVRERILGALRVEPATNADLQKHTGASAGTIRNNLSELMQTGEVEEDGYKGRSKVYRLLSSSDVSRNDGDDDNDETPGQRISRLLNNPPGWLSRQLGQCRQEPERYMKPTAAAIAAEVYGDALRWEEVAPALEARLEDNAKGGSA